MAASKEQRVTCLASAIKGIGKSTAEKLIDRDMLISMPKNWDEFVRQMQAISHHEDFQDVYSNVAQTFAVDNAKLFQPSTEFSECIDTAKLVSIHNSQRNFAIESCIYKYRKVISSAECRDAALLASQHNSHRDKLLKLCINL